MRTVHSGTQPLPNLPLLWNSGRPKSSREAISQQGFELKK